MKKLQMCFICSLRTKFIRQKKNCLVSYMFIVATSIIPSCKKLVEIPPSTANIATDNVFTNDATAISALTGIYAAMSSNSGSFSGNASITHYTALSSDELILYDGFLVDPYLSYYKNQLIANSQISWGAELWRPLFNYVYRCNAAIEGLTSLQSESLTPFVKQQLLGEAKFLRAFFYFYLTNLFGKVPLVLTSDYKTNTLLERSDKTQVYEQIIEDLKEAESLLSHNFIDQTLLKSTNERVRPTKWAAAALLARVYLYAEDYAASENKASEVIANNSLFSLSNLSNVFLKNSSEAILQIQPTATGYNTWESVLYNLKPGGLLNGANRSTYLSQTLLSQFEKNDQRRYGKWVDSTLIGDKYYFFPFKYKKGNASDPTITSVNAIAEYLMIMRLGEQYLIRAEARMQLNKISEAVSDLNIIRTRAGLGNTTANDKASLLTAILKERQIELFTEFGHRWFDLKRTGSVDKVMTMITPLKGGIWQTTDQLYPIPLTDVQKAPNLEQNDGY